MTSVRVLAEGPGFRVSDIICNAGPEQAPFEEAHEWVTISAVISGSFVYRSTHGRRLMTPGSFLLGNQHACFECSHEFGIGDRCIAFHYSPDLIEELAGVVRNLRNIEFHEHRLPAQDHLLPYIHYASRLAFRPSEEDVAALVWNLACTVLGAAHDTDDVAITTKDEARVTAAIQLISRSFEEPLTLDILAAEAGVSKFHFSRVFRKVTGVSPYAYILNRRMAAAAKLLSTTNEAVVDVALACGFGDLSEFTRRFHDRFGKPPTAFRRQLASRLSLLG